MYLYLHSIVLIGSVASSEYKFSGKFNNYFGLRVTTKYFIENISKINLNAIKIKKSIFQLMSAKFNDISNGNSATCFSFINILSIYDIYRKSDN